MVWKVVLLRSRLVVVGLIGRDVVLGLDGACLLPNGLFCSLERVVGDCCVVTALEGRHSAFSAFTFCSITVPTPADPGGGSDCCTFSPPSKSITLTPSPTPLSLLVFSLSGATASAISFPGLLILLIKFGSA